MILRRLGWKFKTPEFNKGSANYDLIFEPFIKLNKTYLGDNKFRFLNREINFTDNINWNYSDNGKLWTYNINYFEFLMQEDISESEGRKLIDNYINSYDRLKDGLEPFPTSLRLLNWVKFLIKYQIREDKINQFIHEDAYRVYHHPEYHLLGNHLLENGFGLYFAAVYLNDHRLYKKAKSILIAELQEQILHDGAHFELSTMYHQHMLFRILDCYQLASQNDMIGSEMKDLFLSKSSKMLSWLQNMTFSNGDCPLLNDSAKGIAPDNQQLFDYAAYLNITFEDIPMSDSGYRRYDSGNSEIIIDAGKIGPDYIPGHAHADSLSFVMNYNDKAFLVDGGTSTYETGERRNEERSTHMHNTVDIDGQNSSEVWAGFRVGKRAKTSILQEDTSTLKASHDGYDKLTHVRHLLIEKENIFIKDMIEGAVDKSKSFTAYFHFHPDIKIKLTDHSIQASNGLIMTFEGETSLKSQTYEFAEYWNTTTTAQVLQVNFDRQLITRIIPISE